MVECPSLSAAHMPMRTCATALLSVRARVGGRDGVRHTFTPRSVREAQLKLMAAVRAFCVSRGSSALALREVTRITSLRRCAAGHAASSSLLTSVWMASAATGAKMYVCLALPRT